MARLITPIPYEERLQVEPFTPTLDVRDGLNLSLAHPVCDSSGLGIEKTSKGQLIRSADGAVQQQQLRRA